MVDQLRYYTAVFICAFTLAMVIAVSFVIPRMNQEDSITPPTPSEQQVITPVQAPVVTTSKTPEACIGHPQVWCGVMV